MRTLTDIEANQIVGAGSNAIYGIESLDFNLYGKNYTVPVKHMKVYCVNLALLSIELETWMQQNTHAGIFKARLDKEIRETDCSGQVEVMYGRIFKAMSENR